LRMEQMRSQALKTDISHTDRLLGAYTNGYMEKVFYFCLKKTGDMNEAEELVSDITVQVLTALRRGPCRRISPLGFGALREIGTADGWIGKPGGK
jgi:DNA-directed RNA polymerase specialized sigma24 family protein